LGEMFRRRFAGLMVLQIKGIVSGEGVYSLPTSPLVRSGYQILPSSERGKPRWTVPRHQRAKISLYSPKISGLEVWQKLNFRNSPPTMSRWSKNFCRRKCLFSAKREIARRSFWKTPAWDDHVEGMEPEPLQKVAAALDRVNEGFGRLHPIRRYLNNNCSCEIR